MLSGRANIENNISERNVFCELLFLRIKRRLFSGEIGG
jgi:hypothetical protein